MAHQTEKAHNQITSFSCRCLIQDGEMYLVEPAPYMYRFFGTTEDDYQDGILARIRQDISKESSEAIMLLCAQKAELGEDFQVVYPSRRADGSACMVRAEAYAAGELQENGGRLYDVFGMDITEMMEAREQADQLAAENLALTEDSPVGLGIYHIRENSFDLVYTNAEYYHVHCGSRKFWDRFKGRDALERILPEDRHVIHEAWESLLANPEKRLFDVTYRCYGEDGELHWIQLLARLTEEVDGKRICYASYINVDREKQAEIQAANSKAKLMEEMQRQEAELERQYFMAQSQLDSSSGGYLAAIRVNLTRDAVETLNEQLPLFSNREGFSYSRTVEALLEHLPRVSDREKYQKLFSREALLHAYEMKKRTLFIEYVFRQEGRNAAWVHSTVKLVQRPVTGDIIAFNSVTDVTSGRILDLLMNKIMIHQYDFIVSIDATRNAHEIVSINQQSAAIEEVRADDEYERVFRAYVERHVVPEEKESCIAFMTLPNVLKALEKAGCHTATFNVEENGELRNKKLDFYYLDRESQLLALIRTDFTDIQRQQLEQEERLRSALSAARQASIAKSEFLSRMSHEIRTPMNAIIGLDTIAMQEKGLSAAMQDHLQKIGISARFLLSLINDILDMSRIESGRMLLKNEEFDFRRLLDSINTILYSQCQDNEIDYECVIKGYTEESYIGDELKLQQVLINILGNAVKFTPKGGRIRFLVEQLSSEGTNARLQFTIADTGIGIDEEFLPQIFDAFAQENRGRTSSYGGTGLGLAISRSLVKLMDGSIQVHSVKGVGTDFTIDITVGLPASIQQRGKPARDFSALRTLIVDDDLIDCQHAEIVLRQAGILAQWVKSGGEAVERVKAARRSGQDYRLVIIDWKMPEMDGIETARAIRKIAGPEVTILILTAYDWSEIEQKARNAGVDSFMRKPIFASSVIQAYDDVCKRTMSDGELQAHYDFSGKRILVVEDNEINAEIARTLLEMKGFAVDVASNGVEAIRLFTESKVGGYAAILMDIRMPYMDGLEATKTIRAIRKEDSQTIPIVAMSANAFDEDVQKSLESGMNDHLSKPLDTEQMYAVLDRLIRENPWQ